MPGRSGFVFPGDHGPKMAESRMWTILRDMGVGATVHGFQSSLRDWAGEETNFPREVYEAGLAHATVGAVEAAYRRGDALEKRRGLMTAWATFVVEN